MGEISSDIVFAMLARGALYVDLRAAPLAEPGRVQVFRDQETAQGYTMITSFSSGRDPFVTVTLGASVAWDGRSWTIVNLGATQVTLLATDGTLINLPQTTFESLIKAGRLSNPEKSMLAETHPAICELLAKATANSLLGAHVPHQRPVLGRGGHRCAIPSGEGRLREHAPWLPAPVATD